MVGHWHQESKGSLDLAAALVMECTTHDLSQCGT